MSGPSEDKIRDSPSQYQSVTAQEAARNLRLRRISQGASAGDSKPIGLVTKGRARERRLSDSSPSAVGFSKKSLPVPLLKPSGTYRRLRSSDTPYPRWAFRATLPGEESEDEQDSEDENPFQDAESSASRFILKLRESIKPDLERRSRPIWLEKVSESGGWLWGAISVKNLAFEKKVVCRFTFDNWTTNSETDAEFSAKAPEPGYDRFIFKINANQRAKFEHTTLLLCCYCRMNEEEWWDNNDGANYEIGLESKRIGFPATSSIGAAQDTALRLQLSRRGIKVFDAEKLKEFDALTEDQRKLVLDPWVLEPKAAIRRRSVAVSPPESGSDSDDAQITWTRGPKPTIRERRYSDSEPERRTLEPHTKGPIQISGTSSAFSGRYNFSESLRVAKALGEKERERRKEMEKTVDETSESSTSHSTRTDEDLVLPCFSAAGDGTAPAVSAVSTAAGDGAYMASVASKLGGTVQSEQGIDPGETQTEQVASDGLEAGSSSVVQGSSPMGESEDLDNENSSVASNSLTSVDLYKSDKSVTTNPTSFGPSTEFNHEETLFDERENPALMTFYNYQPAGTEVEAEVEDTDDIQSVLSATDDISSLAESNITTPAYRQTAVDYLVKTLTGDVDLIALYRDAITKMDEARFVRNHRRLLKTFFLDLAGEGQLPSEKLAIRFLRRRSDRVSISAGIFRILVPSEHTLREKIDVMLEKDKDNLFLLDRLLAESDAAAPQAPGVIYRQPIQEFSAKEEPSDTQGDISEDNEDSGESENSDDEILPVDEEEDYQSENERDGGIRDQDGLPNVQSAAEFLISGQPYQSYKKNLERFLRPGFQTPHGEVDIQSVMIEETVDEGHSTTPSIEKESHTVDVWKTARQPPLFSALRSWIKMKLRPKVKEGYKRIEWTCDCGEPLYGDFLAEDDDIIEALSQSLQNPSGTPHTSTLGQTAAPPSSNAPPQTTNASRGVPVQPQRTSNIPAPSVQSHEAPQSSITASAPLSTPKFLALCINIGGMYKALAELDTSTIQSDAEAFSHMKAAYKKHRGLRSRFTFLRKPVTVEFVRFTLWNLRQGYVSVCERPISVPPDTNMDYEYLPRPLRPLPPMPPEIFIHYLQHGDGDINPNRRIWLPRLPKRLDRGIVQCGEAADGWGIHVIEGANREVVFWIVMVTVLASVLAGILWSALQSDIQGGTGLGAMIMALPPVIMAAFLFRSGS